MSEPYAVRPIEESDVIRAFSVVRAVRDDIPLREWRAHLDDLRTTSGPVIDSAGAMVLAGPKDYLYGVFTYQVARRLGIGRRFEIDDFCVMPLTSRGTAIDTLLTAAERLARELGCRALTVSFLDSAIWHQESHLQDILHDHANFVTLPPSMIKHIA